MSTEDINRLQEFAGIADESGDAHRDDKTRNLDPSIPPGRADELDGLDLKEVVFLPDGETQIINTARSVFTRMAGDHTLFTRGGAVVEVRLTRDGVAVLDLLKPEAARTRFEERCKFIAVRVGKNGEKVMAPRNMAVDIAESLLLSKEAREILPPITGLINCPILREDGGAARIIGRGYDATTGLMITGGDLPPPVDWQEAVKALKHLHSDFRFQTAGDASRAMAMLLTPALKLGGMISGSVPIDIAEADESQSGKNYRLKLKAAVYNEPLALVSRREGGVGSMDETFSDHLVKGRPFPTFDNLRGPLDSQFLESFLTAEGSFSVRIPYHGNMEIDPSRFFVAMTSNGVETTRDLANRACIVRIRKQTSGYPYQAYAEGDVLSHVKAHQPYYLGCVFAVIQIWLMLGKPGVERVDHDFREWARVLGWIVPNLFSMAPLLDGHRAAQNRVGNNALNFLRNVALAHRKQESFGTSMIAGQIANLCQEDGVAIPGLSPGQDQAAAGKQIGVLMARAFESGDRIDLDGFVISRHTMNVPRDDGGGTRPQKSYEFRLAGAPDASRESPSSPSS